LNRIKLAIAQFPIRRPASIEGWQRDITDWVMQAADADLLVFPEYAGMALAGLLDDDEAADLARSIEAMQEYVAMAVEHHRALALQCGVHIVQGSLPWRDHCGRFVNRAFLHTPTSQTAYQDKRIMTRFEREIWGIIGSGPIRVFPTDLGTLAILICYDAEFPLLARAISEAGAEVLLVPSCTESEAGYWRVRIACQARAVEAQCLVAQSPTVGDAPWSPAVDRNWGAAGLFGPPDRGFPSDGVLALGEPNATGWVRAEIELAGVARVRVAGEVLNHRDWAEQGPAKLPAVEIVDLRSETIRRRAPGPASA